MIAVDLQVPAAAAARAYDTVATIHVQDGRATFTGRRDLFATDVAVFDERTGTRVRFDDDPEAWARNLHTAYRTAQLVPVITEDTRPNPPVQRSRRPAVTIPAPARR